MKYLFIFFPLLTACMHTSKIENKDIRNPSSILQLKCMPLIKKTYDNSHDSRDVVASTEELYPNLRKFRLIFTNQTENNGAFFDYSDDPEVSTYNRQVFSAGLLKPCEDSKSFYCFQNNEVEFKISRFESIHRTFYAEAIISHINAGKSVRLECYRNYQ